MQPVTLQKMELINKISFIPKKRIKEVKTFIDFILSQSEIELAEVSAELCKVFLIS